MNNKQKERVEKVRQRWLNFKYKGQTDHDVRFLLRMINKKDPNYINETAM